MIKNNAKVINLFKDCISYVVCKNYIMAYFYININIFISLIFYKLGYLYFSIKIMCMSFKKIKWESLSLYSLKWIFLLLNSFQCKIPEEDAISELYSDFLKSESVKKNSKIFLIQDKNDIVRLRLGRSDENYERQGNLIILKKPNLEFNEMGVILLKYNQSFEIFPKIFNLNSILKEYRIVFEPSWYNNISPSIFLYSKCNSINVFQASQRDYLFLNHMNYSFYSVDMGAGDWVDVRTFNFQSVPKKFDVVMIASWARFKRHHILFEAIQKIQKSGKKIRCALIGYPLDLNIHDIMYMSELYGVKNCCEFFENISPEEVAYIVSSSRLAVHLSVAEGANKASYESLMCNVPLIVYKHNKGFRRSLINEFTGIFADDQELDTKINFVLNNLDSFSPRKWVEKNSGYINASKKLNNVLKYISIKKGENWTCDIVEKVNKPNLYYANKSDIDFFYDSYSKLKKHFFHN